MKLRSRLLPSVVLALALLVPAVGAARADEAAEASTATGPAASEPEPEASPSVPDCGCEARSPAQLLETRRQMSDPAAEPGS